MSVKTKHVVGDGERTEINWSVPHETKDKLMERREELSEAAPQGIICSQALREWYGEKSDLDELSEALVREVARATGDGEKCVEEIFQDVPRPAARTDDLTVETWRSKQKAHVHTHIPEEVYELVSNNTSPRRRGYVLTLALEAYFEQGSNAEERAVERLRRLREYLKEDDTDLNELKIDSGVELDPDEIDLSDVKKAPEYRVPVLQAVIHHETDKLLKPEDITEYADELYGASRKTLYGYRDKLLSESRHVIPEEIRRPTEPYAYAPGNEHLIRVVEEVLKRDFEDMDDVHGFESIGGFKRQHYIRGLKNCFSESALGVEDELGRSVEEVIDEEIEQAEAYSYARGDAATAIGVRVAANPGNTDAYTILTGADDSDFPDVVEAFVTLIEEQEDDGKDQDEWDVDELKELAVDARREVAENQE